ncbi:MAG: hypothetical protein ACTSQA_03520 [Candidatus Heimdallarchaeaceae archaeon]
MSEIWVIGLGVIRHANYADETIGDYGDNVSVTINKSLNLTGLSEFRIRSGSGVTTLQSYADFLSLSIKIDGTEYSFLPTNFINAGVVSSYPISSAGVIEDLSILVRLTTTSPVEDLSIEDLIEIEFVDSGGSVVYTIQINVIFSANLIRGDLEFFDNPANVNLYVNQDNEVIIREFDVTTSKDRTIYWRPISPTDLTPFDVLKYKIEYYQNTTLLKTTEIDLLTQGGATITDTIPAGTTKMVIKLVARPNTTISSFECRIMMDFPQAGE